MSQENVEIMRKAQEAFDRRDRDAWFELVDPDLVVFPADLFPEGGQPMHGRETAWDFYVQVMEPFAATSGTEHLDLRDAGANRLVGQFAMPVRGVTSGAEVNLAYSVVTTLRKRRIICQEWFADHAEALEAVGLSE